MSSNTTEKAILKASEIAHFIDLAAEGKYSPFSVEKKTPKKEVPGVTYYNMFVLNEKKEKIPLVFEQSGEVPLIGSMSEFGIKNNFEPSIAIDKSGAPDTYKICAAIDAYLEGELARVIKESGKKITYKEIVKTHYTADCPDVNLRNKPYADSTGKPSPRIRINIAYNIESREGKKQSDPKVYKNLKTIIYRLDKLVKSPVTKVTSFAIEKSPIEKIHNVFPVGTKIVDAILDFSGASVSNQGFALKRILNTAFVSPGVNLKVKGASDAKMTSMLAKYGAIAASTSEEVEEEAEEEAEVEADAEEESEEEEVKPPPPAKKAAAPTKKAAPAGAKPAATSNKKADVKKAIEELDDE